MILAILALTTANKISEFDYIDVVTRSFIRSDQMLSAQVKTSSGLEIFCGCCDINTAGEAAIDISKSPAGTRFFVVRLRLENYLTRSFKVASTTNPRPKMEINRLGFIFGDINGDNVIDKLDVQLVQEAVGISWKDRRWSKFDVSPDNSQPARFYDFNGDGKVDENDVRYVSANVGKKGS